MNDCVCCIFKYASTVPVVCYVAGQHARILSEPDPCMEVPVVATDRQVDRTLIQSSLLGQSAHYTVSNHHRGWF